MGNILVAEDNKELSDVLELFLTSEGYNVFVAQNGKHAINIFDENNIDLGIFDIMMPIVDGYDLIKHIRDTSDMPIFILSAKDQDSDKILGLNLGADDYITKPFNPLEVVARVNAAFRRLSKHTALKRIVEVDDLKIDIDNHQVSRNEEKIDFTITEFKILKLLVENADLIFSKVKISEHINGHYFESDENTITVHISHIKKKLGKRNDHSEYIKTVRGLGYKFERK